MDHRDAHRRLGHAGNILELTSRHGRQKNDDLIENDRPFVRLGSLCFIVAEHIFLARSQRPLRSVRHCFHRRGADNRFQLSRAKHQEPSLLLGRNGDWRGGRDIPGGTAARNADLVSRGSSLDSWGSHRTARALHLDRYFFQRLRRRLSQKNRELKAAISRIEILANRTP
jgi:hypothetical protein